MGVNLPPKTAADRKRRRPMEDHGALAKRLVDGYNAFEVYANSGEFLLEIELPTDNVDEAKHLINERGFGRTRPTLVVMVPNA